MNSLRRGGKGEVGAVMGVATGGVYPGTANKSKGLGLGSCG